ncbi:hypothetical protein QYF61_001713 [Mycteria americana]|uniref:Uncharacterized protein n=1 Tax=Mycteria americana TaxID=33587 RepID=A0AAN7NCN2_MYCAM|nr:hypothetical protein QYF61_001713 [Mycteria americana]
MLHTGPREAADFPQRRLLEGSFAREVSHEVDGLIFQPTGKKRQAEMMMSFRRSGKFKNIFWELLKSHVRFEEKKTKVDRNWSKITKDKVAAEEDEWNAEQPQLSQPVLIGEVLQPSDHFRGPPLDLLQQFHVLFVLRAPELDAVLQVRSHQSRVEGQNHLPRPAGHTSFDAAQDKVGRLGCKRTLPAHVQLFIHQYPQVLFRRAALDHIIPQPVLIPRIVPTLV